jgi:hypothetical protein
LSLPRHPHEAPKQNAQVCAHRKKIEIQQNLHTQLIQVVYWKKKWAVYELLTSPCSRISHSFDIFMLNSGQLGHVHYIGSSQIDMQASSTL